MNKIFDERWRKTSSIFSGNSSKLDQFFFLNKEKILFGVLNISPFEVLDTNSVEKIWTI